MKKASALQSALLSSGSKPKVASAPAPANDAKKPPRSRAVTAVPAGKVQASRADTKPITVHFPEEVRRQLKSLSADLGRHMDDLVAEGLNLLFALHKRPEIAPRKPVK